MASQEPPRFFIDETDLGLAKALAAAQAPVVHPGHKDLPEVPIGTPDPDWIPIVARMNLVVITRDKLARQGERELLRQAGLRVFRIGSKHQLSTWATVQLVAGSWERLEAHVRFAGPGPWMALIDSAGTVRPLA